MLRVRAARCCSCSKSCVTVHLLNIKQRTALKPGRERVAYDNQAREVGVSLRDTRRAHAKVRIEVLGKNQ
jgi:hypothetical protein